MKIDPRKIAEVAKACGVTIAEVQERLADERMIVCACGYPTPSDSFRTTYDDAETMCEGCVDEYDHGADAHD